jgi:uncharacterized ion transporter superfamily protein YfcC
MGKDKLYVAFFLAWFSFCTKYWRWRVRSSVITILSGLFFRLLLLLYILFFIFQFLTKRLNHLQKQLLILSKISTTSSDVAEYTNYINNKTKWLFCNYYYFFILLLFSWTFLVMIFHHRTLRLFTITIGPNNNQWFVNKTTDACVRTRGVMDEYSVNIAISYNPLFIL